MLTFKQYYDLEKLEIDNSFVFKNIPEIEFPNVRFLKLDQILKFKNAIKKEQSEKERIETFCKIYYEVENIDSKIFIKCFLLTDYLIKEVIKLIERENEELQDVSTPEEREASGEMFNQFGNLNLISWLIDRFKISPLVVDNKIMTGDEIILSYNYERCYQEQLRYNKVQIFEQNLREIYKRQNKTT